MRETMNREHLKDREPECRQDEPQDCCAMRASARHMIEREIAGLRSRADGLQALLGQIPTNMTSDADEALWSMVCASRR